MTAANRDREAVADKAQPVPPRPDARPISTEHKAYEGGIDLAPVVPNWSGKQ